MRGVELSPCAVAMLTAFLDSQRDIQELQNVVTPADDVDLWYEELQELLDRGYAVRIFESELYRYAITQHGYAALVEHTSAWLHPHVGSQRFFS